MTEWGGSAIEVETRFWFEDETQAMEALPFLSESLDTEVIWRTEFYGYDIFRSGQLLRIADSLVNGVRRVSLGWKGPDTGVFANIREELEEPILEGVRGSRILARCGVGDTHLSPEAVGSALERSGLVRFMSFSGRSRAGFYAPFDLHLKLMHCSELRYPLMVEIEKTAFDYGQARDLEQELYRLAADYAVLDRAVREEPPTLLSEALGGASG